jgi:DNA-binding SARP family transcriptional activator/TolB-like protein/tetratricopeptide (TPR) repeat protein
LTLRTLGAAFLSAGPGADEPILFGPGKPLASLAYLSCAPNRTVSRDQLIDLLWTDSPPDAGQHNLRQTLWYIRQRTGEIVSAQRDDVRLAPEVNCDRDAFLAAVQRSDAAGAVALYRGEFLPRGAGAEAHVFEEWADRERYRLRRLFARMADLVARGHLRAGRFPEAEQIACRVRDADAEEESGWRLLLETLLLAREAGRAASEADVLEWELAVRGREPEPLTRELVRRIREVPAGWASPARSGLPEPRLVGREEQLAALLRAWEATTRGCGAHVDIIATAGFGKTRLLAEARARLDAAGATTVSLAANPATREVSHVFAANLAAALAALPGSAGVSEATAAALVALDPALSSRFPVAADPAVGDEAARRRLLALLELLAATSEERPLALLLDDVHWADVGSRQILDGLLAPLERMRVLVVTAARPSTPPHGAPPSSEILHLPALDLAHVRAVLADLGALPASGPGPDLPGQLRSVSGGSPLVLLDVLYQALAKGVLALDGGGWRCPNPGGLAAELEALAAARLQPIESHPRSLLVMPFVAGDGIERYSDALSEDLVGALSRLDSLRVVAWPSARKLKGTDRDPMALATELSARYVVLGRADVEAADLKITARLIDGLTGGSLWEAAWHGKRERVTSVVGEFSRGIAEVLLVDFTPTQVRRMRHRAIPDGKAYECYLRAREAMGHGGAPDDLRRAIALLRKALKFGGENARLYSALGTAYANDAILLLGGERSLRRIEVCARKALALDPDSAEAFFLAGLVRCRRGGVKDGVREMLKGLAIDSHHTDALYCSIGWLGSLGRVEIARPLAQRLLEIDPLTPMNFGMVGWAEWLGGRFESALGWYQRWLDLEPKNPAALHVTAQVFIWCERFQEARVLLGRLAEAAPTSHWTLFTQPFVRALEGDKPGALASVTQEIARAAQTFEPTCWSLAGLHAMLDARDEAITWLERAVRRGFINYPMLAQHDPFLTRLRGYERYDRLMELVKQEWESLEL